MAPGATTNHIYNEWEKYGVQPAAQNLIAHMLHHDASKRMTAAQALKMPWISGHGVEYGDTHMVSSAEKMRKFQLIHKLKRAVTKITIIRKWEKMMSDDVKGNSMWDKIAKAKSNRKEGEAKGCQCIIS